MAIALSCLQKHLRFLTNQILRTIIRNGGAVVTSALSLVFLSALSACGGGGGTVSTPDTEAPQLSITSPISSGSYVSSQAIVSLAGTATDNLAVTAVSWSNNRGGQGDAVVTGTTSAQWSAASIPLQLGSNTLNISVRDAAGNVVSRSILVTYEMRPGLSYFMAPTGDDGADCKTLTSPCKTFAHVFPLMAAGDELVLLDGVYSSGTTGTIHWDDGPNSAQIPSGTVSRATYVHALNPGKASIFGRLFIGRSTRKDSYITVQGLEFEGGGDLYNTSFVTLKDSGFHGPLDVGTNDHDQGNTDNLIEDVWVWAAHERIIALNYRAHRTVWRRVVVRGDGCGTVDCTGDGNPNVGFSVYDSHDVSVQNVMVLDRVLEATDAHYSDFAIASHTGGLYTFGRNEWLGTLSLNAPDQGYYMEPDVGTIETSTIKMSNTIAWNAAEGGYNLGRAAQGCTLENMTLNTRSGDGLRIAPELTGAATLTNLLISGSGRYGLNSAVQADFVHISGTWSDGSSNQTTPLHQLMANANLSYPTRIEAGSPLKNTGAGGLDIGATMFFRYGVDGTRFGETDFNTLGSTSLWPWPNETRIRQDMCATTSRGFCSTGKRLDGISAVTLTSYIWEAIGTPLPAGIYP